MNRSEHVAWAKARALYYVEMGLPGEAISSMISDLNKHPDTEKAAWLGGMIAPLFAPSGGTMERWAAAVSEWIEGFN